MAHWVSTHPEIAIKSPKLESGSLFLALMYADIEAESDSVDVASATPAGAVCLKLAAAINPVENCNSRTKHQL